MRTINRRKIKELTSRLAIRANTVLRPDLRRLLLKARRAEKSRRSRRMLDMILKNARIARKENLAICQDTGLPVVFVELGEDAHITGGSLKGAITSGIKEGYRKGFLRRSIVIDPILRGKPGFIPPVIHIDLKPGKKLNLTVFPKGFGSENKSKTAMLNPASGEDELIEFVVKAVKEAGPDACPPYIVGVGIGGTLDKAVLLSKKVLLGNIESRTKLEKEILTKINKLGIGPFGLGGKTTALSVKILTYPTHIAGKPVAVNISCHALRSATANI